LRITPSCRNGYQNLGQVGKENLKKILWPARAPLPAIFSVFFAALVSACSEDLGEPVQSGRVLAWQGLQGRWVGSVVPTEHDCGSVTQGLMSIGQKGFGFDPFVSTVVIRGEVREDGHLRGSTVHHSADHQDVALDFEGFAARPDQIDGTLQSGRCSWTVTLHRG
jgi:hypothetical protein